ncbi:MAG: type IV secretory system conjugative DNA transfer family protein [Lachnospiraceae bacterium]|nr:type IV secretory system conjugative DNA transfer family protein [Lachnospiraceae bacterium]
MSKRAIAVRKTHVKGMGNKVIPRYGRRCLGKGIYVSNDSRKTRLNNTDLVISGSGGGKTGCIVYPQLKTLNDSSLIVADSKNMLHRMFKEELEKKGYKVLVLDFVNPKQSCLYNPLRFVRRDDDGNYNEMDIMKISAALLPQQDKNEPFWETQGRAVLDFFISYCLSVLPEEDHNMYAVTRLYHAFTKEMGESGFIGWIESHPGSFTANRYEKIKNMKIADKTWSSILSFVNVALYPFDVALLHHIFDPDLYKVDEEDAECCEIEGLDEDDFSYEVCPPPVTDLTFREEIDIEALGKEKTVVFLNISDTDHSLDCLVNLFYSQALQTLVSVADRQPDGRLEMPCRIIFDDFASGTRIEDFDKVISIVRSRDIWVTMCIQSLSQLESLYSKPQALTIINNCDHLIYMGCNDLETAIFIGTRAGKVPEEILSLDRAKEYFIESGKKAILVDKIPPYSYSGDEDDLQNPQPV